MPPYRLISAVAAVALAGCMTTPPAPESVPFSSLEGTDWQLIEIMDGNGRGTMEPRDPTKYVISFAVGGKATLQLDCNRGTTTWINAISNATGGSLEFGPLATTRALCPPATLGDVLGMQLPAVRSFRIDDGKLYMSVMADGGTIVWDRVD